MRNWTALFVSIALGLFLGASPAFALVGQVPEPSSLVLVGIGAVSLYAFLKRKH
jgi:PEP-CTERM motif-containing protein